MSASIDAITVKSIAKRYASRHGSVTALDDVTFAVGEGEFVAVVGPSGCGKSTLLKILAGLLPSSGGEALRKKRARQLRQRKGHLPINCRMAAANPSLRARRTSREPHFGHPCRAAAGFSFSSASNCSSNATISVIERIPREKGRARTSISCGFRL